MKVFITAHSSNGTWIVSETSNENTRLQKEMPTQLNEGDLILLTRSTDTNHDVIAFEQEMYGIWQSQRYTQRHRYSFTALGRFKQVEPLRGTYRGPVGHGIA